MNWIISIYECGLCMTLTWKSQSGVHNLYALQAACCWWAVCSCCNKQEVRCCLCFNLSHLLPTLHSGSSPVLPFTYWGYLLSAWGHPQFWEICKCKFKIYGIWPQASTLQTHFCYALLLVWGSLKLTPIIGYSYTCALFLLTESWGWPGHRKRRNWSCSID